jgi:hypothetical protein
VTEIAEGAIVPMIQLGSNKGFVDVRTNKRRGGSGYPINQRKEDGQRANVSRDFVNTLFESRKKRKRFADVKVVSALHCGH